MPVCLDKWWCGVDGLTERTLVYSADCCC